MIGMPPPRATPITRATFVSTFSFSTVTRVPTMPCWQSMTSSAVAPGLRSSFAIAIFLPKLPHVASLGPIGDDLVILGHELAAHEGERRYAVKGQAIVD